jgi:PKD repeat protein
MNQKMFFLPSWCGRISSRKSLWECRPFGVVCSAISLFLVLAILPGDARAAGALPVISAFEVNPDTISLGEAVALSWEVTGATALKIDQGVGPVTSTATAVKPTGTTTYTLTATNASGSRTAKVTVTVLPPPPVIKSFGAAPESLEAGQSTSLKWSVSGATSLSIDNGVGTVTGTSRKVSPTAATTYTLTAKNAGGTKTATVTVNVMASLPTITSFTASPNTITAGGSAKLSWRVSGATSSSIDHGVGIVEGTSCQVTPATTMLYILSATNATGTSTEQTTVTVVPRR